MLRLYGEFLSIVAHDLRNPLSSIGLRAQSLLRAIPDEQQCKQLKAIESSAQQMNALIQDYAKKSSPKFCAKAGMTDEIVDMNDIRPYIQAFANACYQNPESICPVHQMLLPRVIRDYDALNAQ